MKNSDNKLGKIGIVIIDFNVKIWVRESVFYLSSIELRELESKLKAGYMNRERAAQLAEKRLLEIDEQVAWKLLFFPLCKV